MRWHCGASLCTPGMPGVMPTRQPVCAVEHEPSEQLVGVMLSTVPSQLSSSPLHTSANGELAVAEHCVPVPSTRHTNEPVRAHAPTPTVQLVPRPPNVLLW